MRFKSGINLFALIEIFIGTITLIGVVSSLILKVSTKPPEVLAFVLITACISSLLGIGLFKRNANCYYLLIYFSSIIVISKILIFANIIQLNGALETNIPSTLKNIISIIYHSWLIIYLRREKVRKKFIK